ncbi:MAG: hypothetical protein ACOYJD_07335 [Christensenellales bacterium]|jgi:hypothetical protein
MARDNSAHQRLIMLEKAFKKDGFSITEAYQSGERLGIAAKHDTAVNYDTGEKKACYYLEGTPYERGYLLGLLAEPSISKMAVSFTDNIIFDFIGLDFFNNYPLAQKLIVSLLSELSKSTWASQPRHIQSETEGMMAGCRRRNRRTSVTLSRLIVMNVGFDVLCALVYTGSFLRERAPRLSPEHIRLSMMCNAFSVFGKAANGGHLFARDFMFSTGGSFQNHLAHILHLPQHSAGDTGPLHPYISVTAPGIAGSISAMNINGVAAGINMSPAANCDPSRIGTNSLLLLRECVMSGATAKEAANVIRQTQRGVSWNYVLSDGCTDTALTVEAGASWPKTDFLSYPDRSLLKMLPDEAFLLNHKAWPVNFGCAERWCGNPLNMEYLNFNEELWRYYSKTRRHIRLLPGAMLDSGFINRTPIDKNCPSGWYFAPQRTSDNVHITTNHFISPHMRLCGMDPWTLLIAGGHINDIQWRYDELNSQIRHELSKNGYVNYAAARRIAEYLAPYGNFPHYYSKNPKSQDGQQTRIEGCISLFDLKARSVESHYGYYGDDWVKTTLPLYFPLDR